MDIRNFFMPDLKIEEEIFISDRFKDENGERLPFIIKAINEKENEEIRKICRVSNDIDYDRYLLKLAASCVVSPNLEDSNLQSSYGVLGADCVLAKMLLAGEYAYLLEKVQNICGFMKNDMVLEIKNV